MEEVKHIFGALVHDIGKPVHRSGDGRSHSVSGAEFLSQLENFRDETEILDCIRYHHKGALLGARIPDDSPAYIVYFADNLASAADRRKTEDVEEGGGGAFNREMPLESVFGLLKSAGRQDGNRSHYPLSTVEGLVYPVERAIADQGRYSEYVSDLKDGLKGIKPEKSYLNSLLELLEAYLSYVPSSTNTKEVPDIPLFDHLKITAAATACIKAYLDHAGRVNYRRELLENEDSFWKEKAFLMYSCDISGIQRFIYTISGEGVIKSLRSRSFYLEILMENFIDEVLSLTGMCRANVLYSGGGHCYMLLPNTPATIEALAAAEKKMNAWLMDRYRTSLYLACAFQECSGEELKGLPDKPVLPEVYKNLSRKLSEKKLCRYSADDIRKLNSPSAARHDRECKVCGAVDRLMAEDVCEVCASLIEMSPELVKEDSFFVVAPERGVIPGKAVALPSCKWGECYMGAVDLEGARRILSANPMAQVRLYGKNKMHTGLNYSSRLWMGTFCTRSEDGGMATFEELAKASTGVERIGVLRADVDGLGQTFINGFVGSGEDKEKYKYETLSRKAILSRLLTMFFKKHINEICAEGPGGERFSLSGEYRQGGRKVTIVYSGGDDMFIVGAWNEVIELAVDLRRAFERYTQGKLTFSAGIGLYPPKYPAARMAYETAELLDAAKGRDGKNSIALFEENNVYSWADFEEKVVGEKLRLLQKYFSEISEGRPGAGNAFLYSLLDCFKNAHDRINVARCAYLLGRMAPEEEAKEREKEREKEVYREFSRKVYGWICGEEDRRQFVTAANLYAYLTRKT